MPVEIQALSTEGREQYSCEQVAETANVMAGADHFHEEPMQRLKCLS